MIKIIASDAVPEGRAYLSGQGIKLTNPRVRSATYDGESLAYTITYDVEYDACYQAVIYLGDD
jgi:hypothetical protein